MNSSDVAERIAVRARIYSAGIFLTKFFPTVSMGRTVGIKFFFFLNNV